MLLVNAAPLTNKTGSESLFRVYLPVPVNVPVPPVLAA